MGIAKGLLALGLALVLATGAAAGCREMARRQTAEAIATPQGIDEAAFVPINGLDQWITIRGQDRTKPVVLVLHGGPGGAISHLVARMAPLEHDYVVVQWDQRGAGKTLAHAQGVVDPGVDIPLMVRDGIAVTDYLRAHLHRGRIILLGWSWGSDLGVRMVEARPDLFSAYVGTGQAASAQPERDVWDYAHLMAKAQAAGDAKALEALKTVGPPPWADRATASGKLWAVSAPYRGPSVSDGEAIKAALTTPHWTVADLQAVARGRSAYKETRLERELWTTDYMIFGRELATPVLIIEGEDDVTSPADHARAWLDRMRAPAKAMVVIPGAGHQALLTHNAEFAQAMAANLPGLMAKARRGD